jgi:hypothetical protein
MLDYTVRDRFGEKRLPMSLADLHAAIVMGIVIAMRKDMNAIVMKMVVNAVAITHMRVVWWKPW